MKTTIIKAGYRVTISTWENDCDNWNTSIVEGLTRKQAEFLVDLCEHMGSVNSISKKGFGNIYDCSESDIIAFSNFLFDLIEKHFEEKQDREVVDVDEFMQLAHDSIERLVGVSLFDINLCGGDFFTRVCDSYKVEFSEADIHLLDVTETIKNEMP